MLIIFNNKYIYFFLILFFYFQVVFYLLTRKISTIFAGNRQTYNESQLQRALAGHDLNMVHLTANFSEWHHRAAGDATGSARGRVHQADGGDTRWDLGGGRSRGVNTQWARHQERW